MKKILATIFYIFIASVSYSQIAIPNSGFESWNTSAGYENPDNWDNMNSATASQSIFTCTKGTPGSSGNSYLNLTSKVVNGNVIPGIAVCGTLNKSYPMLSSGFAFTNRPQSLVGKFQFMPSGFDAGFVYVLLSKWNSLLHKKDTIANYYNNLGGMVMSWKNFSCILNYQSTNNPDSCLIIFSASNLSAAANGSYFYLDSLAFSGLASTASVPGNSAFVEDVMVSPNPASDKWLIKGTMNERSGPMEIELINALGKVVFQNTVDAFENHFAFSIAAQNFPNGIYFLLLKKNESCRCIKISK